MRITLRSNRHYLSKLFILILFFAGNSNYSYAQWTRINPGGGGAFTSVGVGPSGLVIATSDLGGAYVSEDDGASWKVIGAERGMNMTHVQSVVFDPDNDKIVLISGDSDSGENATGIFRSEDQAYNFDPAEFTPALEPGATVKSLVIAPSQTDIIYASVRSQSDRADSTIYRSSDNGKTFTPALSEFPVTDNLGNPVNLAIMKLVVHPKKPQVLLALSRADRFATVATNALYMSIDGGDSWQLVTQDLTAITDVVFHPAAPYPVYISDRIEGYFYNEDIENATNWISINSTIDTQGFLWPVADNHLQIRIIDAEVSWFDDAQEVAWQISSNDNGLVGSWVTEPLATARDWTGQDETNWKAGWSKIHTVFNSTLGGEFSKTLGYDISYQSNPDRIYWVNSQFTFRGNFSNTPIPMLEFEPAYTTEEIAASIDSPGSDTWKSTGIDNITATLIDVNATNPNTVYIGLQDIGCFVSRDAGEYWKSCNYLHFSDQSWSGIDGLAYGGSVYALLSDPANDARVWMAASPGQSNIDSPDGLVQILTSDDYGETWQVGAGLPDSADIYGLSIDPTDPEHQNLYVTVNGEIYQTSDGGINWDLLSSDCAGGCRVTAVDPNGNLYAGGESGLFYLPADSASGWTRLLDSFADTSEGIFQSAGWQGISAIKPEQSETGYIFVIVFQATDNNINNRGGIYECNPEGFTTQDKSDAAPCTQLLGDPLESFSAPFMRDLAIDPLDHNMIYATSSSAYTSGGYSSESLGVIRSFDYGRTWTRINNGLAWPFAIPISISPADPDKVYIGSPGPGFYKRDFTEEYYKH